MYAMYTLNKYFSRLLSKGDLVNWETSSWDLSHMEVIEKSQDEVCLLPKPRDIVFPELRENEEMHLLCNKLKGSMSITDSQDTQNRLVEEFSKKMPDEYNEYSKLSNISELKSPRRTVSTSFLQQCSGQDGMTLRMREHLQMLLVEKS